MYKNLLTSVLTKDSGTDEIIVDPGGIFNLGLGC